MINTWLSFGDLARILKVTAELIRSNVSVCGWGTYTFSENNSNWNYFNSRFKILFSVIQWLNKQINETQLQHRQVGTFEMPRATSNFRPSGAALVS